MTATSYLAAAPVVRRVRGYFAPVNRAAGVPVLFDPAEMGGFALNAPPAPWISLGWIDGFKRSAGSKTAAVLTGIPAAVLEQTRETLDAEVSFQFLSWTKLSMALATGSQHMNLLAPATGAGVAADGGVAAPGVTIAMGATATFLPMAAADAAKFTSGQMVAVDVDYLGQTGFVGSPVSGAYVKTALSDVDYVRRVTFNVALVASVSTMGLMLAEALPGGFSRHGSGYGHLLGGDEGAGVERVCGSRGWEFLSGVVGGVCDGGWGRASGSSFTIRACRRWEVPRRWAAPSMRSGVGRSSGCC